MKFNPFLLREALKLVNSVVDKKPLFPILEGVKIADKHLTASNGEVSVCIPVDIDLPPLVLDYATLKAGIDRLTDDQLELLPTEGGGATLKSGRTKINIPAPGAASDFPKMAAAKNAPTCILTRPDVEHITALITFRDTAGSRPALTGVYSDGVDFVCTNSTCLANYKIQGEPGKPSILPVSLLTLLNGFSTATEFIFKAGNVTIKKGEEIKAQIKFRTIDENFPDWKNVVPDFKSWAGSSFERDEMLEAIEILKIGANKTTLTGAFEFATGGGVTASARDLDLNKEAETKVTAENKGVTSAVKIGLNANLFSQALKYVGGEEIILNFDTPQRSVIITRPEFSGFALVMPVMLAQ